MKKHRGGVILAAQLGMNYESYDKSAGDILTTIRKSESIGAFARAIVDRCYKDSDEDMAMVIASLAGYHMQRVLEGIESLNTETIVKDVLSHNKDFVDETLKDIKEDSNVTEE